MNLRSLCSLVLLFSLGSSMAGDKKTTYGYVEKATLVDNGMVLSAKFDTGAKSASLSATNIQEVNKEGKLYLRFTVPGKTKNVEFISEYIGKVKIKARAGEHTLPAQAGYLKRPVIKMRIKIGDKICSIAVNLTNRKRFNYPLLLGRDAINSFNGLVDPSKAFKIKIEPNKPQ